MFSANQIEGFFDQPYPQNLLRQPDFLHIDTNSHKLKFYQKILGWPQSKIGVVSLITGI